VEFTENELRQLLFSPHGRKCAESLLSMPEGGTGVILKLADGTVREAHDAASVRLILEEVFQWDADQAA
jgi:hypothetical protein